MARNRIGHIIFLIFFCTAFTWQGCIFGKPRPSNFFFAWSEFSLKFFCADFRAEFAIKKHTRLEKLWSNCAKNMKTCLLCKFRVQRLKFCADSRKFYADMRPRVSVFLEALGKPCTHTGKNNTQKCEVWECSV